MSWMIKCGVLFKWFVFWCKVLVWKVLMMDWLIGMLLVSEEMLKMFVIWLIFGVGGIVVIVVVMWIGVLGMIGGVMVEGVGCVGFKVN